MSELAIPQTRREVMQQAAQDLDYYIAPYCGDVYLTALDIFSRFKQLKQAHIYPRDDLDYISGGKNRNGDLGVWVGLKESTLTLIMKMRTIERFGLSHEFFDAPDSVFMPFIFAHELGHVIQEDPAFANIFGVISDDLLDHETDYAGYVNSDVELNADYIAAVIIGNSSFGIDSGFMPPVEPPLAWREWAATHDIPHTIAMKVL